MNMGRIIGLTDEVIAKRKKEAEAAKKEAEEKAKAEAAKKEG
jgi:hypothetical protein